MTSRKWIVTIWAMVFISLVTATAVWLLIIASPMALGALAQSLGGMMAILGIYGAVNVAQKKVQR